MTLKEWGKRIFVFLIILATAGILQNSAKPEQVKAQTIAELQAQIQILLAQLAILQAQLAQSQLVCTNLTSNLYFGLKDSNTGGQVSKLQSFLKSQGDYTYPEITGYFGYVTQASVQKFQKRIGLVSTGSSGTTGYGVVGPITRSKIKAISCPYVPVPPGTPLPPPSPIAPPQPPSPPTPPPTGCVRANPTVTITPPSVAGTPGQTLNYNLTVKNKDSSSCPSSVFGVTTTLPPGGFTGTNTTYTVSIAPGGQNTSPFTIKSPTGASNGNHSFIKKAKNNSAIAFFTSVSGSYLIGVPVPPPPPPPPAPPQPSSKKFFMDPAVYQIIGNHAAQNGWNAKKNWILDTRYADPNLTGFIDLQLLQASIISMIPPNATGYAVLDFEDPYLEQLKAGPGDPEFIQAQAQMVSAINLAKQIRPLVKWGYYAIPNMRYWLTSSSGGVYSHSTAPASLIDQAMALAAAPTELISKIDFAAPSIYEHYPNTSNSVAESDAAYIKNLVLVSKQIFPNKPTYVYIAHRFFNGDDANSYSLVPENEFVQGQLNISLANGADGFVWWGADNYWWTIANQPDLPPGNPLYLAQQLLRNVFENEIPSGMSISTHLLQLHENYGNLINQAIQNVSGGNQSSAADAPGSSGKGRSMFASVWLAVKALLTALIGLITK